jgi:hypothetical protein
MPRRHPESQYIGEASRPPIGDGPKESRRLSRQNRLVADPTLQESQPTVVVAGCDAIQNPGVEQPACETHPDP